MRSLHKLYYKLTANVPRKLPETEGDIKKIKEIFTQAFGLEDSPQVWYTVFANMASIKSTSVRVPYASLVNIAKRLTINKILQDQKIIEHDTHMLTLKEQAEAALETPEKDVTALPIGAPDVQGELPIMQEPASGVV